MTPEEIGGLRDTFGVEPEVYQENGVDCVVFAALKLPYGCNPAEAMAIFHRGAIGSYETRLFFDKPVSNSDGSMPNIHEQRVLGRTMFAASIRGIPANLPPHQAILAHLRMYKK